MSVTQKTINLN